MYRFFPKHQKKDDYCKYFCAKFQEIYSNKTNRKSFQNDIHNMGQILSEYIWFKTAYNMQMIKQLKQCKCMICGKLEKKEDLSQHQLIHRRKIEDENINKIITKQIFDNENFKNEFLEAQNVIIISPKYSNYLQKYDYNKQLCKIPTQEEYTKMKQKMQFYIEEKETENKIYQQISFRDVEQFDFNTYFHYIITLFFKFMTIQKTKDDKCFGQDNEVMF